MNFRFTPEQEAWRETVRAFLAEHWDPNDASVPDIMTDQSRLFAPRNAERWMRLLRDEGWGLPSWPRPQGGMELGKIEQFIMRQEFTEAGAPMPHDGVQGATFMQFGSQAQRERYLPPMFSGEEQWCSGLSEPGAGSDLASLSTTARLDGDVYIVNGQKIWTSHAHEANFMMALVRTDPDAPKHRGISMLIVDLHTPGITILPFPNMAGIHHHNQVFFQDVRVPRENLLGEENRGWYQVAARLDTERSGIGSVIQMRQYFERVLKQAGSSALADSLRTELADRWIEISVAQWLSARVVFLQAAGEQTTMPASIAKLYATELKQRLTNTLMKVLGLRGMLWDGTGGPASDHGLAALHVTTQYMNSVGSTIGAGTSEIQRNVIAGRGLDLPRS
jgi:alkylation response protein AidB-like acyl-CoA dehydrogenase